MKHHWRHAGWEAFCEQFPIGMKHHWSHTGEEPYTPKVSCRSEARWFHSGRKLFKYDFIVMRFRALRFFPQILVRSFFSHQEKKKVRIMATVQ